MKKEQVNKSTTNIFSPRERDILACITVGHSNKAAALILKMSNRTVDTHIRNIYVKTGATSKEQVIDFLSKNGLLEEIRGQLSQTESYQTVESNADEVIKGKFWSDKILNILKKIRRITTEIILVIFGLTCYGVYHVLLNKIASKIVIDGSIVNSDNYIERKKITRQMDAFLSSKKSFNIVTLMGHGGAGKTTIAKKYLQNSGYDFAYEINAETITSTRVSIRGLAYFLAETEEQRSNLRYIGGIAETEEREKQMLLFIRSELAKKSNWCLLFDNVENFEILKEFCPCGNDLRGNIIITTRNGEIQNISYLGRMNHIVVDELMDEEKERLFNAILGKENKWIQSEIRDFLKELPSFPLDVSAAAYYVKNVDITLQEYTKLLKTMGEDFLNLNEKLMFKYNNYNKTRYGIISSTLKSIMEQNNKFKEILLFIFLVDSQEIPIQLLKTAYDQNAASELLFYLKKYFLITSRNETISVHRKTQQIGLHYLSGVIGECGNTLEKVVSILTPYEYIDKHHTDLKRFIPHLKVVLKHLDELNLSDGKKAGFRIDLLVTIGNIFRYKEQSIEESINYFEEALRCNTQYRYLNKYEIAKIMLTAGESCVLLGRNDLGERYLKKGLADFASNKMYIANWADSLRLLGIIYTRRGEFDKANDCFDNAMKHIANSDRNDIILKFAMARIYSAKSLNYLTHCINKEGMNDAVDLIKKAINILEECRNTGTVSSFEESALIREIAGMKIRLSGLENGIMNHDVALQLTEETEELLKKLPDEDNSSFCSYGMIFMEKAHAYLRMNELQKAKEMFSRAREICDKAPIDDYIWRIRMQQTETLVRLGELEEAYKNCTYMFSIPNRERNIAGDLFYNTCYYNAAVIQYRLGNKAKAAEHFYDFIANMKKFCKEFLKKEEYEKLIHENVFEVAADKSDIKKYFSSALKIFTAVCKKGSGFITDYVEKNFLDIRE
ncbi:MAG: LuxR C-terminal-related transcriptional regulator [Prevotellaceae bacterium]|jgi:DNA-binding CsgD family transcriptional regulator/tetratricopeptide (TPR) repeat protein|nr:LuxR C-terminal-related transcriptional regulator [Prevotellaceae bacterium]